MSKGLNGLNPGNQAFKQFKCPILNVLIICTSLQINVLERLHGDSLRCNNTFPTLCSFNTKP